MFYVNNFLLICCGVSLVVFNNEYFDNINIVFSMNVNSGILVFLKNRFENRFNKINY